MYNVDIALGDVERDQIKLKSELDERNRGDPKNKSSEQLKTIKNDRNLYESREKVIQMFNNYPR